MGWEEGRVVLPTRYHTGPGGESAVPVVDTGGTPFGKSGKVKGLKGDFPRSRPGSSRKFYSEHAYDGSSLRINSEVRSLYVISGGRGFREPVSTALQSIVSRRTCCPGSCRVIDLNRDSQ